MGTIFNMSMSSVAGYQRVKALLRLPISVLALHLISCYHLDHVSTTKLLLHVNYKHCASVCVYVCLQCVCVCAEIVTSSHIRTILFLPHA